MSEKKKDTKTKKPLYKRIINWFIGFGIGIIILLLILFGFSQTSTFREMLRNRVITEVNSAVNGEFNIEKIDGTILTSLILTNTSLVIDQDTLLYADRIELKTSPLRLIEKNIYIRKLGLKNIRINILEDENGNWNISKLSESAEDDSISIEEDTVKTVESESSGEGFSYRITLADFSIANLNLIQKTFENRENEKEYLVLNTDDLELRNLNLQAAAKANPKDAEYQLYIKSMSASPNLSRFKLNELTGIFNITDKYAEVQNLHISTDSSNIDINARLDSLNLFGEVDLYKFKNYPLFLELYAHDFAFTDLNSFITSTDMLNGKPSLALTAEGKFGNFDIKNLRLLYGNTNISITGSLKKLHTPGELYIDAFIEPSKIVYSDANKLLPSLDLPEYKNLSLTNFTGKYIGEPTKFFADIKSDIGKGNFQAKSSLNFQSEFMKYDIDFAAKKLDLAPVINTPTDINVKGKIIGSGTDPETLNMDLKLNSLYTRIGDIRIDSLNLATVASSKLINLDTDFSINNSKLDLTGSFYFDEHNSPLYNFTGDFKNLDLQKFMDDSTKNSDLNFNFTASGRSFDLDSLSGKVVIIMDTSYFEQKLISDARMELVIEKDDSTRMLSLISDFVDLNINGKFELDETIKLIAYEAETVSGIIEMKAAELNPLSVLSDSATVIVDKEIILEPVINNEIDIDFDFKFNDFSLIALFMGMEKLDIIGSGNGSINNDSSNFSINSEMDIEYFVNVNDDKVFYFNNLLVDMNFSRNNQKVEFDNLFGALSLTGERIYAGSDIKNFSTDFIFNQSKVIFNIDTQIDSLLTTVLEGQILMEPEKQRILFDRLSADYNGIQWANKDQVSIEFTPNSLKVDNLELVNDNAKINIDGEIKPNGDQNFSIFATNVPGRVISKLLTGTGGQRLSADINFFSKIHGTLDKPEITADFSVNEVEYANVKLGTLSSTFNYFDENLDVNISFLDTTYNMDNPRLKIVGNIPINLSFTSSEERMSSDKEFDIDFTSSGFDLRAFGSLLPAIQNQRGQLKADLQIGGNYQDLRFTGTFAILNGFFTARANNLDYAFGLRTNFKNQTVTLDSLIIQNAGGERRGGIMYGAGYLTLDEFKISDADLNFFGEIALLGPKTKAVNPSIYGHLLVGSEGNWNLGFKNGKPFLKAIILLRQTDMVFTSGQEGYTSSENINFVFIEDTTKIKRNFIQLEDLLAAKDTLNNKAAKKSIFAYLDYEIEIRVVDDATITFILSQAANQKLIVEVAGNLRYENIDGNLVAQGSFDLLQGSKLEFFKIFEAQGSIRFESDVTDPYLDIVAVYRNEYSPPNNPETTQEVAVKFKLQGPLSKLGQSLSSDPDNIAVYIGTRNIENDIADNRYDAADAFSFILVGKFRDDLTSGDKNQLAGELSNTASYFVGSLVTGFVNSAVGDVVNNISFRQSGESTKFSVSGKIQKIRYSIGGTTEVFQNVNRANIRIEYIFNRNFSIRIERKDPIVQTYSLEDKINELGLKYRFEF
ncbi:MAG: hypothetical protein K9J16_07230 [Melioribacteraceae bacterium]|nr:hypothetical protein [Melioribacteraceae bacterium]MCF8354943.1 hypothetical protein [Melioribacteraceae bacterium]MCF8392368.1 hypothetical protein [Melioribacteraceae bacterium]MCF8417888.1 hypothetical protein [Melioribacteraceae bacterium]